MNDGQETQRKTMFFREQFKALTGFKPMRWQQRLYAEYFAKGALPSAISVPTGLGKTAVMAIWLIALAQQMKSGQISLPRRLVYVVDRRAVVDQATQFAENLRSKLQKNESKDLREALRLDPSGSLPISTLRGQFVDNRDWLADPSQPAIIVGTVDMIGSRLLFEGYGVSRKMRPYHAGLLGADTLVLLDEAHLVPPFEALLAEMAENTDRYGPQIAEHKKLIPAFQLLPLSATGRRQTAQSFTLQEKDFRNPDDTIVLERLFAEKHLTLQKRGDQKLEDALAKQAWTMVQETQERGAETTFKPVRVIVYCHSRDVAEKTRNALDKNAKQTAVLGRTELLVGARRIRERVDAERRLRELGFLAGTGEQTAPSFLVATSAGEVGIDLDADHMVCDLVAWERMVQRFGRVNRRGGEGRKAEIVVIDEGEPEPKKQNAPTVDEQAHIRIYQSVKQLFEKLHDNSEAVINVNAESLRQLNERAGKNEQLAQLVADASSPAPLRPALNRALVDAWSMTSLPEHTGRPEVAPWLRGWVKDDPQTTVIWREHLPVRADIRDYGNLAKKEIKEIEDYFEAAPLHTSERLEVETRRYVVPWLQARAGALNDEWMPDAVVGMVLDTAGKLIQVLRLRDIPPAKGAKNDDKKKFEAALFGKALVMDARFGGWENGLLKDDSSEVVPTADDGSEWLPPILIPTNGKTRTIAAPIIRFRVRERRKESDKATEEKDDAWHENQDFVLERSPEGEATRWLSIQKWRDTSNNENDRAEGRPQALAEHQCWAAERAEVIGRRLGLPDDYIAMLKIAARRHDEGKQAKRWQRAFHAERDAKKFKVDGPLAKTRGPINQAVLGGYRHEFGSLPHAKSDPEFKRLPGKLQELALHLIAAHHGYARPLITTKGCEDAPPSALEERAHEVALRFARLQKRWGPWGLAWWEALLRAADVQASRDNDNREGN